MTDEKTSIEQKMTFMVGESGDMPLILMGIPEGAWEYMKDGKTHHFDLSKAGVPIKLMLFGAKTHDEAMKIMLEAAAKAGATVDDRRNKDFGMDTQKIDD